MGRYALAFEHTHQMVRYSVVYNSLADYCALFGAVESSCIILVGYNAYILVVRCKHLFRLTLVKLYSLFHVKPLRLLKYIFATQ